QGEDRVRERLRQGRPAILARRFFLPKHGPIPLGRAWVQSEILRPRLDQHHHRGAKNAPGRRSAEPARLLGRHRERGSFQLWGCGMDYLDPLSCRPGPSRPFSGRHPLSDPPGGLEAPGMSKNRKTRWFWSTFASLTLFTLSVFSWALIFSPL